MPTHFLNWAEPIPDVCRRGALTLGNFDGVHRGHQALLAETRRRAATVSGPAVAITFHPHPLAILRPQQFQPLLTTAAERAELMHGYGAVEVIVLAVTHEFLQLSARDFFNDVLCAGLDARVVIEGPNFGFGRKREGNIDILKGFCDEERRDLIVLPPFEWAGKTVSSSRVRNELLQGAVRNAADLLGRPFRLVGVVGRGQERGRKLGFPTANLEKIETLLPADGVYAVRATFQERTFPAAANIGPNPTFGERARKVEVHLIGFDGDLHGKALTVDFIERLRETRPFAGVEQLVAQLKRDVEQARVLVLE